jgi:hypothetical protein
MQRKTQVSNTTAPLLPCAWPRAMRPPLAALYVGGTSGLIEQLWRDGLLPYRLVGGVRVVLREDLDKYLDRLEEKTGKLNEPRQATLARKAAA